MDAPTDVRRNSGPDPKCDTKAAEQSSRLESLIAAAFLRDNYFLGLGGGFAYVFVPPRSNDAGQFCFQRPHYGSLLSFDVDLTCAFSGNLDYLCPDWSTRVDLSANRIAISPFSQESTMLTTCPHCASRLKVDEKVIAITGGGACPACGRYVAFEAPPNSPPHASPFVEQRSPARKSTVWDNRTILIAAGVVAVSAMFVTFGVSALVIGAISIWPDANSSVAPVAVEVMTSKPSTQIDKELETKRNELNELSKECIRLDADAEELKQRRDALERDIQGLTARLDALNQWKRADFMMINANSFAVGFKVHADGRLEVAQKAEGEYQQDAIRWARKAGQHPIDQNQALTRTVFESVAVGETVPGSLAQEIRRYWKPQQFVPYPPEKLDPPFIVFQDAEYGRRHLGFFLRNDSEHLWFREVAPTDDMIHRNRLQVGCVRMATGSKILSYLNEADFLDYCVLNAAQKLGSIDGHPSVVRVAVHLEVDALQEEKALSELADTRGTDKVFEYYARLHEKPYPRDARKEPVRILRETAMYVEDELYQKLTRLAVPIVERQQIDVVIDESDFGRPLSAHDREQLTQLGATHLLFADLKKSQDGGRYHLAFRLTDVRRGEVLWAESGERLVPQPNVNQRFLLQTGQVALIRLNSDVTTEFHGCEHPPILMPANLGKKSQCEHLVIVEGPVDGDVITYRGLFSAVHHDIPKSEVKAVKMITKDEDVPTALQMRYIVWKLASKMLPVAGRAIRVDGDRATISLGSRDGLKDRDTLHVLRQLSSTGADNLEHQDSQVLLATSLSVTEVHENFSRVVISNSGLTDWQDDLGLLPDDLVIKNSDQTISIAMLPPTWKAPGRKVIDDLRLKYAIPFQRAMIETEHTALKFKNAVSSGLRALGISVFTEFRQDGMVATGASHVFGGYIEPLDANRYHVESKVFPLNAQNVGLIRDPQTSFAQLGQELMRVDADINLSTLK